MDRRWERSGMLNLLRAHRPEPAPSRAPVPGPPLPATGDTSVRPSGQRIGFGAEWRPSRSVAAVAAAIGVIGALIRVRLYLRDRSLWFDEAMLAFSVVHRSVGGLVHPLAFDQGAPLGFLLGERLAVNVFGPSEAALRLLPLLASLVALPLCWALARRLFPPRVALILLAFLAFGTHFAYYGTEMKQYSSDVAVALALVLIAVEGIRRGWDNRWLAFYAVSGAVAVWCSHPAVLVLAGVSVVAAWLQWRRAGPRAAFRLGLAGVVWVVSFGVDDLVMLRPLSRNQVLRDYWKADYLPFPPRSLHDLTWGRHVISLFSQLGRLGSGGISTPVLAVTAAFGLVGFVVLLRGRPALAALLAAPMVMTVVASAARLYPFGDRLALFLIPLVAAFAAVGIDRSARAAAGFLGRTGPVAVVALALAGPVLFSAQVVQRPVTIEELRPVLAAVDKQLQPGDGIYVDSGAVPGWLYYAWRMGLPARAYLETDADAATRQQAVNQVTGYDRAWVIVSHVHCGPGGNDAGQVLAQFASIGWVVVGSTSAKGSAAFLVDNGQGPGPSAVAYQAQVNALC